mgnify:CR=1 FL=1
MDETRTRDDVIRRISRAFHALSEEEIVLRVQEQMELNDARRDLRVQEQMELNDARRDLRWNTPGWDKTTITDEDEP